MCRIMILDAGNLAEMDTPTSLLAKEDGLFRSLWDRHQRSHCIVNADDDLYAVEEVSEEELRDLEDELPMNGKG